jgi:DNA-binding XRE family transcriptional regulator
MGESMMDLTTARAMKRKTQWDIRKQTGIHQSKISLIERGYVAPIDAEKALIARILGFHVDEIDWQTTN